MRDDATAERAFILGLDGVPWRLIESWVDDGELPNFARLVGEGVGGELESTMPATTPVAWPAIATGTGPDKHGIYGFMRVTDSYALEPYNRSTLSRPSLWEMVSPSVVGNVPMTHPPSEIDGKLVTGMITPHLDAGFAHPESLEDEILREIPDYQVSLNWNLYKDDPDSLVDDLTALVEARRALMRMLMDTEDWRLFFFVYTAPDRLQHLFWEEDVLLEHYQKLDSILGEVMDYCDEHNANLFVVSDHGFGPIQRTVNVNSVLEAEGFLARKESSGSASVLAPLGITKDRVKGVLRGAGLDLKNLVDVLPERVVNSLANSIPGDNVLYDVDRERTSAFMHGPGHVFINATDRFDDGSVAPANRDAIKADLLRTLPQVTDPATGDRILEVHDGDAVFPADDTSPDLVVEPRDGYDLRGRLADEQVIDAGSKAGNHRKEGLFGAWGPDISADATVADATVFDVAPTVLHVLGEPLPETRDGDPLFGILDETPPASEQELQTTVYSGAETGQEREESEDFDEVEERLRGLGYVE
jgi:predicted AlkP superfamily phosphohydrolase/phosphomutase